MKTPFYRNEKLMARACIVIVFLALIRCTAEFFRLKSLNDNVTTGQVTPFIMGAMITSIACMIMTILSFYSRNRLIIIIAVLAVAMLVYLKSYYSLT